MTTAGSRYLEGRPRLRHAGSYALYAVPGCRSALLAAIDAALMDLRILTWQERRKRSEETRESAELTPAKSRCRSCAAALSARAAMTSQERFSVHSQLEHLQAKYVGTGHADTTKLCAPQTADRVPPFCVRLPPLLTVAVDDWWQ